MKVIISSKQLASELNKIDFKNEQMTHVVGTKGMLVLHTNKQSIEIQCEIDIYNRTQIGQGDRRWDWVKILMNQVDEQPVTLHIANNVNVTFQY